VQIADAQTISVKYLFTLILLISLIDVGELFLKLFRDFALE